MLLDWILDLHPTIQAAFVSAGAALFGAFLGALLAHGLRQREDHNNRGIELTGLLRMLVVETRHNDELLREYQDNPSAAADIWHSTLRVDVWEDTRIRLSQLVKNPELLASLTKYYEAMRAASQVARFEGYPRETKVGIINGMLSEWRTLSHNIRLQLEEELKK